MTDAQRKRAYVSDLYSGPRWKKRVEKMSDEQITAIYLSHQADGTKPEHDEETHAEPDALLELPGLKELVDSRPKSGLDPHHNEDEFTIF